jgi:hypothetical protein
MNQQQNKTGFRSTAIAIVATAIVGSIVFAQQPGQQQPGGFPGGQGGGFPGGGPGGGQFGQGRGFPGQGGPGGGMPFLSGTITGGDLSAGVILIQGPFGGEPQTVKVTGSTKVVSQKTASVSDLAVGDQVQVQGVPTSITASSLTAGTMPDFFGGGRGGPGFGGQGPGGPGFGQNGRGGQSQAFASASGKITSTSPLTISIGSDVSVVLKLASSAKITKYVTGQLSSLKQGDRVLVAGQPGADGSFAATTIGLNIEMGGGRGGFGGPGGFGGRGGFGQGGPGGPQGFGPGGPGGPGGPEGPPPGPGEN